MTTQVPQNWTNLRSALALLVDNMAGFGGLYLKTPSGAVQERAILLIEKTFPDLRRLPRNFDAETLFGGIDLLSSLTEGRRITHQGLAHSSKCLVITGSERLSTAQAALLAALMDATKPPKLILFDEGHDDDPLPPEGLLDRLAFGVNFPLEASTHEAEYTTELPLRACGTKAALDTGSIAQLTQLAAQLGIDSMRAPLFAAQASRCLAQYAGRTQITEDDIMHAAQLVLTWRARTFLTEPETEDDTDTETTAEPQSDENGADDGLDNTLTELPQQVLDAIKAYLNPKILDTLSLRRVASTRNGQAGAVIRGNRRGRPQPSRRGKPNQGQRLDVVASLRAAVPWQKLRRNLLPSRKGLIVLGRDLHIKSYQSHSDRLVIFAVDASGSSAVARLAEAKGAVELMLGHSYTKRDHVALIAFRGDSADLLLPPTRSLVQTKRALAALPGGGATPLALGMQKAIQLAEQARKTGLSPVIALLTDGRGNIDLAGKADRIQAQNDALRIAQHWRRAAQPAVIIDSAMRPHHSLRSLAEECAGHYIALPRAGAEGIAQAIAQSAPRL